MTIATYPTGTETGFTESTALNSERDRLLNSLGDRQLSFVSRPFSQSDYNVSGAGSLDVDIAAGVAFVSGHLVINDATITKTLDDNATNDVYIIVDDAETDNAAISYETGGSTPTAKYSMQIATVTTSSGTIDSTTDERPYVPYRENSTNDSITGRKSGVSGDMDVATTGVKTVSVSFSNQYRNNADNAQVTLQNLDNTSVEFGYIRVTSLSTSGFTIEANVVTSGSSGDVANFYWEAYGD